MYLYSLVEQIISQRNIEQFKDMHDFCMRIGSNRINRRILTTLIGSGAMDSFGKREDLFRRIDSYLKNAEQASERNKSNIQDLFGEEIISPAEDIVNDAVSYTHLTLPTTPYV